MTSLKHVVQANGAKAAHKLLQQVNGECSVVVAYPAVVGKKHGTLHYIACSSNFVRSDIEDALRPNTFRLIFPRNECGDWVVMVDLRPSEVADRLRLEITLH